MPDPTLMSRTTARLWGDVNGEEHENTSVNLDVERTEPNEIALHLFIEGKGAFVSYYLDRDAALELATKLLLEARTR